MSLILIHYHRLNSIIMFNLEYKVEVFCTDAGLESGYSGTDVYGCSQWNGVSVWEKVCTQRPGCEELHVSITTKFNMIIPVHIPCMSP